MDAETLRNDPRTRKAEEFIQELKAVRMKYGMRPTEVHVNPNDTFLKRFNTIGGLKVISNHHVPISNLVIL